MGEVDTKETELVDLRNDKAGLAKILELTRLHADAERAAHALTKARLAEAETAVLELPWLRGRVAALESQLASFAAEREEARCVAEGDAKYVASAIGRRGSRSRLRSNQPATYCKTATDD